MSYFSDVNECLTDNGGCMQICINTVGSYRCACGNGYELANDNHTCTGMCHIVLATHDINHLIIKDIGECLTGAHNCSQICVETTGGYRCSCSDGYELGDDGVTCEGVANSNMIYLLAGYMIMM